MTSPRARRRSGLIIGAVVVAAVLGATVATGLASSRSQPAARRSGPPLTTTVTREDLVDLVTFTGTIGHGAATPIGSRATGTVTWLPAPDTVIDRGEVLFKVDERPVVLLLGLVPMYRALSTDTTGPDVKQFEDNLRALGYGGFTADSQFSAATATAVRQWQHDLGLPVTGEVGLADVLYAPAPVRVDAPLVRLGASATGDLLSVTGTTTVVQLSLPPTSATWAEPGTAVTIDTGTGQTDGTVAQATTSTDGTTVTVLISVPDQTSLDGVTSVQVEHVSRERRGVLTVPVTALLALDSGGYGVELADGRIVAVRVGMFAGGRVEISGPDISAGVEVGIPQ